MEIVIIFCLIVIMALLSMIAAAVLRNPERRTLPECREERKLAKEKRAEQRERTKDQLRHDALMREVETYNGGQ